MNHLLFLFCLEEAGKIVQGVKDKYPGCEGALNCTDDRPAQSPVETIGDQLNAYRNFLPDYQKLTNSGIAPNALAQLQSQQATAPGYAALNADLYGKYGPQMNQIGSDIARQNALSQAGTDLQVLQGPGSQSVMALDKLQRGIDPEYYKSRELAGNKIQDLFGSMDLSPGLSGSERGEVERSLNRDNLANGQSPGVGSNINTVSNAMQFGQAGANRMAQKQDQFGQALEHVTNFLPQSKSMDAFQVATGKSSQPNSGDSKFNINGNDNTGNQAMGLSSSLLGNISQASNQQADINSNRRDLSDRTNAAIGSFCCFIALQGNNGLLPWFVRDWRDRVYLKEPQVAKGYIRMSKVLVPLMIRYELMNDLVNEVMIKPLIHFGGYLYNIQGFEQGKSKVGYYKFWIKMWKLVGKF